MLFNVPYKFKCCCKMDLQIKHSSFVDFVTEVGCHWLEPVTHSCFHKRSWTLRLCLQAWNAWGGTAVQVSVSWPSEPQLRTTPRLGERLDKESALLAPEEGLAGLRQWERRGGLAAGRPVRLWRKQQAPGPYRRQDERRTLNTSKHTLYLICPHITFSFRFPT